MKRTRATMQSALFEMQKIEERRDEIEGLLSKRLSETQIVEADRNHLEKEVGNLRTALAATAEDGERQREDFTVTNMALRLQVDDLHQGLVQEKTLNNLLKHEADAAGYPVVGLELSEGEPYDIAGVWVVSVVRGGPADQAGIRSGDVISEVSGISVTTREAFRNIINGYRGEGAAKPGHHLSFRIHRENEATGEPMHFNVMVTLGWSARRPQGRRSITVTRDMSERLSSPRKHSGRTNSPSSARRYTTRSEKSLSPVRMSRFL